MSAILLLVLRLLLAVALYAFLTYALFTLWRDLRRQGELLAVRQPPPITLSTEQDSPPLTRQFSSSEIVMGRELTCDFPLNDQTVSSRHARLSYHQHQWWLEDMGSTNGTLLNGESVKSPVVITHGDVLRLGQVGVRIMVGLDGQRLPA